MVTHLVLSDGLLHALLHFAVRLGYAFGFIADVRVVRAGRDLHSHRPIFRHGVGRAIDNDAHEWRRSALYMRLDAAEFYHADDR